LRYRSRSAHRIAANKLSGARSYLRRRGAVADLDIVVFGRGGALTIWGTLIGISAP